MLLFLHCESIVKSNVDKCGTALKIEKKMDYLTLFKYYHVKDNWI